MELNDAVLGGNGFTPMPNLTGLVGLEPEASILAGLPSDELADPIDEFNDALRVSSA